jgi:hypothetical protein
MIKMVRGMVTCVYSSLEKIDNLKWKEACF